MKKTNQLSVLRVAYFLDFIGKMLHIDSGSHAPEPPRAIHRIAGGKSQLWAGGLPPFM
jgi:hypothetical protein